MVIIYAYIKTGNNVVACLPFRYNIDDEDVVESREVILEADYLTDTQDSIRQKLLEILDKEKVEYGKHTTELTSDMSGVITIE